MTITSFALLTGIALVAVGVISLAITGGASATALLPVALGVLIGGAGAVANRKPELRRHLLHGAMAVALLGALGSLRGLALLPEIAGIAHRWLRCWCARPSWWRGCAHLSRRAGHLAKIPRRQALPKISYWPLA